MERDWWQRLTFPFSISCGLPISQHLITDHWVETAAGLESKAVVGILSKRNGKWFERQQKEKRIMKEKDWQAISVQQPFLSLLWNRHWILYDLLINVRELCRRKKLSHGGCRIIGYFHWNFSCKHLEDVKQISTEWKRIPIQIEDDSKPLKER